MTVTRIVVLSCDTPHCGAEVGADRWYGRRLRFTHAPQAREWALRNGWAYVKPNRAYRGDNHPGRDLCPTHADQATG